MSHESQGNEGSVDSEGMPLEGTLPLSLILVLALYLGWVEADPCAAQSPASPHPGPSALVPATTPVNPSMAASLPSTIPAYLEHFVKRSGLDAAPTSPPPSAAPRGLLESPSPRLSPPARPAAFGGRANQTPLPWQRRRSSAPRRLHRRTSASRSILPLRCAALRCPAPDCRRRPGPGLGRIGRADPRARSSGSRCSTSLSTTFGMTVVALTSTRAS